MVMLWNGFLKVINGKDREKRSKTEAFPNEDELIWKRSQKWRHLKRQAYRFSVDGRKRSLFKTTTLDDVKASCNLFSGLLV